MSADVSAVGWGACFSLVLCCFFPIVLCCFSAQNDEYASFDCDGMSSQREGCDFLFPLFGVFVLPFGCQIRGSISAVGSGIDRLEALRSLIGGTYKDG